LLHLQLLADAHVESAQGEKYDHDSNENDVVHDNITMTASVAAALIKLHAKCVKKSLTLKPYLAAQR
jgi:hypothetical protein